MCCSRFPQFKSYTFTSVIHFAGKKAVGESVQVPLSYYQNNITGSLILLDAMTKHGVKNLVFSSSATVYGDPERLPITEDCRLTATNPYGRTKLFLEEIFRDVYKSDNSWNILLLRYFNPVGAHKSGKIGENPNGIPNNLMPFIAQVASGKRKELAVFGNNWDTKDGTGVRECVTKTVQPLPRHAERSAMIILSPPSWLIGSSRSHSCVCVRGSYIHVVDLALGHLAAVKKLGEKPGCVAVNLGTGTAYSVLEMLAGVGKAAGKELPYKMCPRREGDVGSCYCDPSYAKEFLGWEAARGYEEMCEDLWRWQSANPDGFNTPRGSPRSLA